MPMGDLARGLFAENNRLAPSYLGCAGPRLAGFAGHQPCHGAEAMQQSLKNRAAVGGETAWCLFSVGFQVAWSSQPAAGVVW